MLHLQLFKKHSKVWFFKKRASPSNATNCCLKVIGSICLIWAKVTISFSSKPGSSFVQQLAQVVQSI